MNYKEWSEEYFAEAASVKNHIKKVRKELTGASKIEARDIRYRIALLYQIYYELNKTAYIIKKYAERDL